MPRSLEVTLSPADFRTLAERDLSGSVCVVFDILRATTSMICALAAGADAIFPVAGIPDALDWRRRHPDVLLAGERDGLRIRAPLTGGTDFDLGNSPREFTPATVRGRTLVTTTTNGTRALRACARARRVLVSSFLNLRATADLLVADPPDPLILVCSGTHEEPALEDVLAAGALAQAVWPHYEVGALSDGTTIARAMFAGAGPDLTAALARARNGRRLLDLPDLREDVACCAQRDTVSFAAEMHADGAVRRISPR